MLLFPQRSVATHVLVIEYFCGHDGKADVTSLKVNVTEPQLSEAEADPVLAGKELAVHSIVTFAGHEITGGVLSSTVISCRHVPVFPQSSVARHVL